MERAGAAVDWQLQLGLIRNQSTKPTDLPSGHAIGDPECAA